MKKFKWTAFLFAAVLMLAACGNSGGDASSKAEESAAPAQSEAAGESGSTATEGGKGQKLVVYSNSLTDERQQWIEERAKKEGFQLEFVSAGGGDIYNRVLAEKSAPQADVVFGLDESMFFGLNDEKLLVPYEPSWSGDIPEDAKVSDGTFFPLVEQRIFMIYNPEFVKEDQAPKKWEDLAASEFAGKYKIPSNTTGGTNQKSILSILLQYVDEKAPEANMGISDEGWKQVGAYLKNGYRVGDGEDEWAKFKDGSLPISFFFSSGIPMNEQKYSVSAKPVNPDYGVIVMREQIGVVNKGESQDYTEAKRFVDWFGSSAVQGEWAPKFGSIPVSTVAAEQMTPRLKELIAETKPMKIDWNFVRQHLNDWMTKVELELYP